MSIGSPASEELAFSITRGIVSGSPVFAGTTYLQTDASINPGNSGGPLVDDAGRLAAVVTWKVAGTSVEGLAFGVPTAIARASLNFEFGSETDATLVSESTSAAPAANATAQVLVDTPDPLESIDPKGDVRRKRDGMTPTYVKLMKWGGIAAVGIGAGVATLSWLVFDEKESTHAEFKSARLLNEVGWVVAAAGAACTVVGFVLTPSLDDAKAAMNKPSATVGFGVGHATLNVRF